ncbi:hypothetical protein M8J77_002697 [Diaphorina citri]|nr:hypothetical protein M8J77_002697 [Diaphorina citri]
MVFQNMESKQAPPPRCIRKTVQEYQPNIQTLVNTPILDSSQLKASLKIFHSSTVTAAISRYKPNRVLNTHPPPVSSEEKELPREARSKLAQLRSGFSTLLNSYRSRIDPNIRDECPLCAGTPHDTNHLFNCLAKPTTLTPIDLWENLMQAATFLDLIPTLEPLGDIE